MRATLAAMAAAAAAAASRACGARVTPATVWRACGRGRVTQPTGRPATTYAGTCHACTLA
eukprot:scaffold94863_cov48-Phaeocystis_antarctica.AAC.1